MDLEFYRQQALRVRDLAEKADPFTRRRLLDLAGRHDARIIERPLPRTAPPVSTFSRAGEA